MKTRHKNLVRSSWLMLVGLMLLVSCSLDNRVIEKPVFLASNTTSIEVSKVTLTDSTTVLDIFARYTRISYYSLHILYSELSIEVQHF